ncbi:hypothetical protein [Nonomuraea sp. NPDC049400]
MPVFRRQLGVSHLVRNGLLTAAARTGLPAPAGLAARGVPPTN